MYFAKFIKVKNILVSVFISIVLSSLATFLYTKNTPGKTKVTVLLTEDYNPEIYFLMNKDYFLNELFERARLQYFINNFQETDNLKKLIFYKNTNIKILKQECKKSMNINYIAINKRTVAMEVADKTQNIEAINLCITSTVDLINNSINELVNGIINEFKFYSQKSSFADMSPEIIGNENLKLLYKNFLDLENIIKKKPIKIKIETRVETTISKHSNVKIYFTTVFLCFLIIAIFIFERKKIFKYF
jgi:hypothetical protein